MSLANKKQLTLIIIFCLLGTIIGGLISFWLFSHNSHSQLTTNSQTAENSEKKPLYWVAPMDANYRRDKPGKSPMGMDLIPYYGNESNNNDQSEQVGVVSISANLINNLGVRTTQVEYKTLPSSVKALGYVSYDEDSLVQVNPRVSGWIEKLYIEAVGDHVNKGQALYTLYSPELVNAQEELLLALTRQNKQLIQAAENRLRALQLPEPAINKLKQTKQVQQHVTYYAPQSGNVESLLVREGRYVTPSSTLLSIVDLSQVWVRAQVFESDIAKVSVGQHLTMHVNALPNRVWHSSIAHIHPMLNATNRSGIVRFSLANHDLSLKPNMYTQVVIDSQSAQSVLQIPREALIRTGHQDRVVLALGDGQFKSIAVDIGRISDNQVEIISGLAQGDNIVSSAQFLLDSESSKTSDFERMGMNSTINAELENIPSATVHGTVTSVMTDHRMVTIDRDAIEKWQRPAASVDFIVDSAVDMSLFSTGTYLMFTFEIREGNFIIVNAMKMTADMDHEMPEIKHQNHSQSTAKTIDEHDVHSNHGTGHVREHLREHLHDHAAEQGLNKVYTK